MKTAIIIHGSPSKEEYEDFATKDSPANSHWIPWLKQQLSQNDFLVNTPEMPEPYNPDYKKWLDVFEQFHLDEDTHLIGHSSGAGFLLRYLSENDVKIGKVIFVAPWINPNQTDDTNMFDFMIDKDLRQKVKDLVVIYSSDDEADVIESVSIIKDETGTRTIELNGKGHFTLDDMGTREFPELLRELL